MFINNLAPAVQYLCFSSTIRTEKMKFE